MKKVRIIIGLCTHRRPQVRATIASLALMKIPDNVEVSLLVADNDDAPSGKRDVTEAAAALPFVWRYLHAPAHNISIARNAILDAARDDNADLLAFLDDDERVAPQWLCSLFACHTKSGTAATVGPVRSEYLSDAPDWMVQGAVHDTVPDVNTDGFAHTGYTCNVIVDLKSPLTSELEFDVTLGRTGGEDTDFFARYMARGGQISFAADAVVFETVPAQRARMKWLLRRRFRMGQSHGYIVCLGAGPFGRFGQAAKAMAKAVCFGCLALVRFPSQLGRNRAIMRASLHIGVVSACLGRSVLVLYNNDRSTSENSRGTIG